MPKRFNVRVYGILISEGRVLLSDEFIRGRELTKFPGGGLEFGEGLADCLCREFREELGLVIKITEHFYTTDFFVVSAFNPDDQVISVYYLVEAISAPSFKVALSPHQYDKKQGAQAFRWMPVDELKDSDLSLVIDRKVAGMITERFKGEKK